MTPNFVAVAIVAGLLSFLTPCVFPMVPVTLAYFGGWGAGEPAPRRSSAAWFAAGIIVSFTILGLVIAVLFGATGVIRFAANPWINLGLAAIFLIFAANLFGLFELSLPSAWLTRATKAGSGTDARTAAGAALLGALFSLTSLTCTAPFVGTLLVLAAQGARGTPLGGMLIFSAAFALPFYVLARAPRLLGRLPRSGPWMHTLRVCVGVLELAAAVKFVANADVVSNWGIVTRTTVLWSWAALSVGLALYLLSRAFTGSSRSVSYVVASLAAIALAVPIGYAIQGQSVATLEPFLPPLRRPVGATLSAAEPWILNDLPTALAQATQKQKPVFIDFTGYTCTNCRWMEAHIFNREDVRAELGNFVLARLYTDGEGSPFEEQQALQERQFGTVALPLYAVVDAKGHAWATSAGINRDPAAFIGFLRSAQRPRPIASLR